MKAWCLQESHLAADLNLGIIGIYLALKARDKMTSPRKEV